MRMGDRCGRKRIRKIMDHRFIVRKRRHSRYRSHRQLSDSRCSSRYSRHSRLSVQGFSAGRGRCFSRSRLSVGFSVGIESRNALCRWLYKQWTARFSSMG